MYAKAINNFGKEGLLGKAIGVFNGLRCSTPLSVIVCTCLLDACVQCNNVSLALRVFDELKHSNFADVVRYDTLMKGYAVKGDVDAARSSLKASSWFDGKLHDLPCGRTTALACGSG